MMPLLMARWQTRRPDLDAVRMALQVAGLLKGHAIQVSPRAISFTAFDDRQTFVLASAVEQGWLFGPNGQVEFRQTGPDRFVVVAFCPDGDPAKHDGLPPGGFRVIDVDPEPEKTVYLWGRMTQGLWREGRIPRSIDLPIQGRAGSFPTLNQTLYRDASGRPIFVHWTKPDTEPPVDAGASHQPDMVQL